MGVHRNKKLIFKKKHIKWYHQWGTQETFYTTKKLSYSF